MTSHVMCVMWANTQTLQNGAWCKLRLGVPEHWERLAGRSVFIFPLPTRWVVPVQEYASWAQVSSPPFAGPRLETGFWKWRPQRCVRKVKWEASEVFLDTEETLELRSNINTKKRSNTNTKKHHLKWFWSLRVNKITLFTHEQAFVHDLWDIGVLPCSISRKYGQVYSLRLGKLRVVVASNSESVKEVLVTRSGDYAGRAQTYAMDALTLGK